MPGRRGWLNDRVTLRLRFTPQSARDPAPRREEPPCAQAFTRSTSRRRSPAAAATSSPRAAPRPTGAITVEVCSACHPFYTGKQKILDSGGRVARFEARYGKRTAGQEASFLGGAHPQGGRRRRVRTPARRVEMAAPTVDALLMEHAELERALADPAVHADAGQARKLGRRYAELGQVVGAARELASARSDLAPPASSPRRTRRSPRRPTSSPPASPSSRHGWPELLVPRDPHDGDDVVMEVKSGEGGEESALFAGDLVRMYSRYAERRGWKVEMLDSSPATSAASKTSTMVAALAGRRSAGRLVGAEVRGRCAPRATGAGHRVAGPHPHLRGGRARLPGHRRRRRASRSTRTTCASTCSAPQATADRASTPPTRRCGSPTCPPASS